MDKNIVFLHMTNFENICHNASPAGVNHILSFKNEHQYLDIKYVGICTLVFGNSRLLKVFGIWYNVWKILRESDSVIIYHSLRFIYFTFLFRIYRKKIIYQVNELYSIADNSTWKYFIERRYLSMFKKVIVANKKMITFCNNKGEFLVRGGYINYQNFDYGDRAKNSYCYCGRIDEDKMGNLTIAKRLIGSIPSDHRLEFHIFGPDALDLFDFASEYSNVKVFMNSSHDFMSKRLSGIRHGLVLQCSSKAFNETSFPSKIYMYLSNRIIPIALNTEILRQSEVSNHLELISEWHWNDIRQCTITNDRKDNLENLMKLRQIEILELI